MAAQHLQYLESEAIYILREIAAQFSRPVLLFSGGKDSTVLLHLAHKAFFPAASPFPVLHIDTGHNFPETLAFREEVIQRYKVNLHVRQVVETLVKRNISDAHGKFPSRNSLQSQTLLDAIEELKIDCCIGGGRRDEEKARAKERIFSVRDKDGKWQPYHQKPELWDLYNGHIHDGENVRAFPISNWSELDVWNYIKQEGIVLPSIYFSHRRECIFYNQRWLAVSEYIKLDDQDRVEERLVRYRTVGDMTCTAAVESAAATIDDVISEIEQSPFSERGETRMDDTISDAAMEDRKRSGYF
jgi:sulfate adenylyltransferase subunit 2